MKQKDSVLKADSLTIVSDSESVTFGTVKQWEQLSGDGLSSLQRFAIVATFDDEETMYFVLEDINPFHFVPSEPMPFKLLKFGKDETGKPVCLSADISFAEAEYLRTSWLNTIKTDKGGEQD